MSKIHVYSVFKDKFSAHSNFTMHALQANSNTLECMQKHVETTICKQSRQAMCAENYRYPPEGLHVACEQAPGLEERSKFIGRRRLSNSGTGSLFAD